MDITIFDWCHVVGKELIAKWLVCPEGASFSLAGEEHLVYLDSSKNLYKVVNVNGSSRIIRLETDV